MFTNFPIYTVEEGLQTLPKLFAALFPNLSDAPVRLQGKALNHVFESPAEIFHSIRKFYVNETLKQIYKIIGSLDFVGNPTMLVSSLFSGVRDLVVAPSTAFLNSPTDPSRVGMGVAKGTLSLLSHSTSGFFSFCAKVSATAGQAVSTLSLDSDFSDWHRQRVLVEATNLNRHWKKRGVQSVGAMIMRPVSDVVIGVAGGVFGLVLSPVKGYRRNGGAGLTRGLAVGGIGLIARPVVGILDAFAHFTGSIHDIAKSVNVLERRLQPAVKIRLSYTFGLLGILMPYELAIARADNLLKLFPLKKSRKAALLIPETVIHVEVLPNNGTDTYAIATSARVVLIRVKKEVSGELSPSLCWEVYFATDTAISSRVVDHGHSGVALTITLMKTAKPGGKDLREKPVSKLSSLNDSILSPGVFSNFDMSDQEEPDELDDLAVLDAGQDYDHATGRGSQGEKLEWFTILAEYQYRRQLGRLHNAISCLMGDFEAVIRDPALGRSDDQRAEGYSTFSIYHFKKEDLSRKLKESPDSGTSLWLENLPWINERTFQETAKKSQGEQELELAAAREDWTYSKQLEASREEAGPEWLITGRARALYMGKESERDGVGEESLNPLSLSEDSNKNVDRTEFSAAKDDTQTHLTEVRKPLVGWDSNSVSYTGAFGIEGVSEHSDLTNTARVDDSKGIHPVVPREDTSPSQSHSDDKLGELRTLHGSYKDEGSMAGGLLSPRRTLKTREDFMHQSFATAAPFNPAMFSTPLGNGSSSVAQSVVTEGGRSVDGSQRSGTFSQQRARSRSEDDVFSSARQRSTSNSGMSSANSGVSPRSESFDSARKHTPRADTRREEPPRALQRPESMEELRRAPAPEKPASEDRLGRMEALMENLIIFNSEQAVARGQPPAVAANEDISLLRQEIVELRKMLQQRKTNDNAFAEIAALREELAWMKGQLQLNQQRPQQEPSVANSAPIPNQVFRPPVFTPLRPALNATETRSVRATASEPPQELVPEVVESPETPPSPATSNNTGSSAAAPAVSWLARNDQLLPQDLESIDEVD